MKYADGDWPKLYEALVKLNGLLVSPGDDILQISEAIKAARHVDSLATTYHTRFSSELAEAKSEHSKAKLVFQTKLAQLLADASFFFEESDRSRLLYAEAKLIEELTLVEKTKDYVASCQLFIKALERVLSNAKHTREDIGRKIKLVEVRKEIKEI